MNIDYNNPWHKVRLGTNIPESVNAIIEIPQKSKAKYELDKETGMLILDRVLRSSVHYPANYGFIPRTYCDDKDPLDILVLSQIDVIPMSIIEANVIGVLKMIDGGELDDKIIAVATNDMSVNHYKDLSDLPEHLLNEIKRFFIDYKKLENKKVEVSGYENAEVAKQILNQSIEDYKKYFNV